MKPTDIYLKMMSEALDRLSVCEIYVAAYEAKTHIYDLESAALQLRKAMEAVAFASIAPNEKMYAQFRKNAAKPAHHGNDYHASSIFLALEKVNPDFYPRPLGTPVQERENFWVFQNFKDDYMNRKQFDKLYDRLGKFLHADNPWGNAKGWVHFAKDLPAAVSKLRALLNHHAALIQTTDFIGTWIVEAPNDGTPPRMLLAKANGPFTTKK